MRSALLATLLLPLAAHSMDLSGSYFGHHVRPTAADEVSITVRQSGSDVVVATVGPQSGSCVYKGTLAGSAVEGKYECTDGRSGPFAVRDIDLTRTGFSARVLEGEVEGRLGGTRTEPAPGWAVNVVEKGDTLLATFRMIDEDTGLPAWYTANPMASQEMLETNGRYSGAVYESTGPYLSKRKVGKVTIEVIGKHVASVDLVIDGVELARKVGHIAGVGRGVS